MQAVSAVRRVDALQFDAKPDGQTQKKRQYYAMLGTRGIWEDGWKAVAVHAPLTNTGHFDQDEWELYNVDVDRSESKDLAKKHPEKLQDIDQHLVRGSRQEHRAAARRPQRARAARDSSGRSLSRRATRYVYYPGTSPVPEGVAVNIRGRSYKIVADVEIKDPNCSGVIFAHGSRFGGHTLFVKDKKLHYVYNFLGIQPEQTVHLAGTQAGQIHAGHGVHAKESLGEYHETHGQTKLYVNDKVVAEGPMRTQAGKFTLSGDGLCVGWDSGDAVSQEYTAPGTFTGGTIKTVEVNVGKEQYLDLELAAAAAFAVE